MSQIEIYIFRHGETDWNKERRFQGHTDVPLNETGRQQATELAASVYKFQPELILTSDLIRAKETAEIVNQSLQVPIIESESLRECRLGDPEGMLWDTITETYGMGSWDRWLSVKPEDRDFAFPNGETKTEHLKRMLDYLEPFMHSHTHLKRIGVSTHGGCVRRLVHHCKGSPAKPVVLPNCVLYKIAYDHLQKKWLFHGLAHQTAQEKGVFR